eukprot:COSAG02_NODE_592_length_19856_cov_19.262793_5_plen_656_part_00
MHAMLDPAESAAGCPRWMRHPLPLSLAFCCSLTTVVLLSALAAASTPNFEDPHTAALHAARGPGECHEGECRGGSTVDSASEPEAPQKEVSFSINWVFLGASLFLGLYGVYALATRPKQEEPSEPEGGLLSEDDATPPLPCMTNLLFNFIFMAMCFSMNHGCIVGCLSLATAFLGKGLGNIQASILYGAYTLTALLLAAAFVKANGPKKSLILSTSAFCCYPAGFFVGAMFPGEEDPITGDTLPSATETLVVCTGALIGGVAAGVLFTAYGAYFTTTCKIYVNTPEQRAKGTTSEQATSIFSGIFAAVYLLCEVLFKVLATILPRNFSAGRSVVLFTYSLIAVVASICMTVINPLKTDAFEEEAADEPKSTQTGQSSTNDPPRNNDMGGSVGGPATTNKLCAAVSLFATDKKMPLMVGINLAFGFASSYLTSYLNGTVVRNTKGWEMIGYYSAITPIVAGLLGVPLGWVGKTVGQTPVMLLGSFSFIFMLLPAIGPTKLDLDVISQTPILVGVYMLEGTARCVFEGANRAVFADFFHEHKEAAFANIVWQSGGASTFGFLFLSRIRAKKAAASGSAAGGAASSDGSEELTAWLGVIFAVLSIPGYLMANKVRRTLPAIFSAYHTTGSLTMTLAHCSLTTASCMAALQSGECQERA